MSLPDFLVVSAECRDLRHAWTHDGETVLERSHGKDVRVYSRRLLCSRCGMLRTDVYEANGRSIDKVKTRYQYPEGYKVPGGVSVQEVRWALFRGIK